MANYFISLNQKTGDCDVVEFGTLKIIRRFTRREFGDETLYKAQDYMDTLN